MKIAMVSEHASPLAVIGGVDSGGQNVHVAALSTALARAGHEVTVYTRRDDAGLPVRVTMSSGVTVEHLDAGPPSPIPKDDIFPHVGEMAARLKAAWLDSQPDVVHAHFWMSGLAALEAGRPLGIPVVQTFHALGTVKRRHQGIKDTSPPERIPSEAAISRRVSRIVATCTDELFELSRLGADPARISVVPCGVDTSLFSPTDGVADSRVADRADAQPGTSGGDPFPYRLVTVGRLVERKGIDDAIRALAEIPAAQLVVAGGPDSHELNSDPDARRLLDLAQGLGVEDRVRLVGRLRRDQVPRLLRAADLAICVPWYEPFGIVPLEAMSCAVPVVGAAVGGISDTVVDGVTGVHVPPRHPARLARAVRKLLAEPERRAAMGSAGRTRVVQRYQWSQVADGTLDAYEAACATRPAYRVALG